ncbi:PspC domain-containing protein [Ornithinimicrobium pratense]|uniref:PspC domain-containing protein n=1 Tax=Ornithinimicrobium pratense TaxID=2593973 RepID=A0A5J6V929_9MICO|nr:PspC domain-containing protein [Ornithinimicrobium pratense]QFG69613.1 PspC domain-containing protein [Ornithinimicrobium pratense]
MHEHLTSPSHLDLGPTPGRTPDGSPPPLPGPVLNGPTTGQYPTDASSTGTPPNSGGAAGPRRAFQILRRSPVRRDASRGMLGGVCAGIARSTGFSVVAVRVIAVLAALLPGTVGGAYLLAWALLPDADGNVHAERAMLDGRPRSLVILGLGGIALIGMLSWAFNTWPLLIGAGIVILVLLNKLGRSRAPHHPHG